MEILTPTLTGMLQSINEIKSIKICCRGTHFNSSSSRRTPKYPWLFSWYEHHLELLNSWTLKSCKHLPWLLSPMVWIIRALACSFFWTTMSYPVWSYFSFQIFPQKGPVEMISAPRPQEWDKEKSKRTRKKSQLWSFSFHFSTYHDLHNFHFFCCIFPLLPTPCSQTVTMLTTVLANAIKEVCFQGIQIPSLLSPAGAIFPSTSSPPRAHINISVAPIRSLRIHTITSCK